MIDLNDPRWNGLHGGYRVPCDPRPALADLEMGHSVDSAWTTLWEELHHQGDVGEASYAAVPHLVRIHARHAASDWNTYALVATIDGARRNKANPPVPSWLLQSYDEALSTLADLGLEDFRYAKQPELVNSILAILAITKGQASLGRLAVEFTDDERCELLNASGFA